MNNDLKTVLNALADKMEAHSEGWANAGDLHSNPMRAEICTSVGRVFNDIATDLREITAQIK